MDTPIFVRRGEMIMPLRVTAKRFKMTYSEMRSFHTTACAYEDDNH